MVGCHCRSHRLYLPRTRFAAIEIYPNIPVYSLSLYSFAIHVCLHVFILLSIPQGSNHMIFRVSGKGAGGGGGGGWKSF